MQDAELVARRIPQIGEENSRGLADAGRILASHAAVRNACGVPLLDLLRRTGTEARPSAARPASNTRWNPKAPASANGTRNGAHTGNGLTNGGRATGSQTRPANGTAGARAKKPSAPAWGQRNGHSNGASAAGKATTTSRSSSQPRNGSGTRNGSAARKEARPDARPARSNRKPALTAGTKAGNSKRFGFTAPPKQGTKKRG